MRLQIVAVVVLALTLLVACGEPSTVSSVGREEVEIRDDAVQRFDYALAQGATCAELFDYQSDHGESADLLSYFGVRLVEIGCISASSERTYTPTAVAPRAPIKAAPASVPEAVSQMAVAFDGDYTAQQIKTKIDRVMSLYGLSLTGDNYSRAGSVLVVLRREYGPSEMEILDYMIRIHVEGVNLSFPDAAAISVTALVVGA